MDILKIIRERHSERVMFDPKRKIPAKDLNKILEAGRWSPTAHNMQNFEVVVVDNKKLLKNISEIESHISLTFLKENYKQLSFSVAELKKRGTGILGSAFPPDWITPGKKMIEAAKEVSSYGEFISDLPALLVITYEPGRRAPDSEGDFFGIISLGCMMENMWLMAQSLGIGFHIESSLGEEPVAKKVKSILKIPGRLRIPFAIRLGYAMKPVKLMRVRRNIKAFTHHNKY